MPPKKINAAEKAAIFKALANAGVAIVLIAFDGSNDSGQIESMGFFDASHTPVIPDAIDSKMSNDDRAALRKKSIKDAISHLAYKCINAKHADWKRDIGSFGFIDFHVAEQYIALTHNQRLDTYDTTNTKF